MARRIGLLPAIGWLGAAGFPPGVTAQDPALVDGALAVRTVVSGLAAPTTMAFLGPDDLLVLEKNTGQVQRVIGGAVHSTVLDLAVNFGSERGLLGIALHPLFSATPHVYLFWTESSTGEDTNVLANTLLFGNRVDRFTWNGAALSFHSNIAQLRAVQQDAGQTLRGNNNCGPLQFGPDGKLYIFIGDVGRRGQLQNLPCGPATFYDCSPASPQNDDDFGGPQPDNAHLTGVVLRLNDDGTSPTDNPFFAAGGVIGGEVGANVQKIFSYGHRNSFGMVFDPYSGDLWLQENGDDSFSELNRVLPGMNSGWVQIMGPSGRIAQYKEIETSPEYDGLQQIRWPPENIADTEVEALERLFMLPGAHYSDPELSWKYEVAPGGIGFVHGPGLGAEYEGALILGGAGDSLEDGHLFLVKLAPDRQGLAFDDPLLDDGVADNLDKWDLTESESLLFGTGFGVVTDIETGPDGDLYVVSLSHGAVYAIARGPVPPAFTKSFAPATIAPGGVSTLTFLIDNTESPVEATDLDFTDGLPAGVTVADPAQGSTDCTGGTLTATPGGSSIHYTGGTVAAEASCMVTVAVTSATSGSHVNTSGELTSSLGSSGTASAVLTVGALSVLEIPTQGRWGLLLLACLLALTGWWLAHRG